MSKNSFSYGVLANIGSAAVPGWLPNHWFREGFGAGSGQGSKEVPGQVLIREVPVRFPGNRQERTENDLVADRGTGFRDGSLGEPVAVALVPALVLKGAILCVRSFVLAV